MAKLGVITDGISLDLEHALKVMQKNGLNQAELQFLGDKEVGDLSGDELMKTKQLVDQYDMQVSCISRHNFAGLGVHEVTVGDTNYNHHMDKLKQCIGMAQQFNAPLVRIMSFRKEMVLFGEDGAEKWNVSAGAWEKLVELMGPVVELAEKENITYYFAQAGLITLVLNVIMMVLAYYIAQMLVTGSAQKKCITIECGLQNGTLAIFVATSIFGGGIYVIPAATYSLIMFGTSLIFVYLVRKTL